MAEYIIEIPQVNINDKEIYVSEWNVSNGCYVEKGTILVEIETSKKVIQLTAEIAGYIFFLPGNQLYQVRDKIGVILSENDADRANNLLKRTESNIEDSSLKITEKAKQLATKMGVSLEELPKGKLIKEKDVLEYLSGREDESSLDISSLIERWIADGNDIDKTVVIVGASDMAKMMIESIQAKNEYSIIGCLDNNIPCGTDILGVQVIGKNSDDVLKQLFSYGIKNAVNAVVGSNFKLETRERIMNHLISRGFSLPPIVHPRAYVEPSATLNKGSFIHAMAYVGTNAIIGEGTIVLTNATVSHDCLIDKNVYLSPGCILGGYVKVGKKALIGMGSTVFAYVSIGEQAIVINGVNVFNNVEKGEKVTNERE